MLKNYLTIAIRNLLKHKVFSFINIVCLSVGVACCLILVLYIQDELSYDQHHRDKDRIYRINSHFSFEDYKPAPRTSPPIVWGIKEEIPEFEIVTRVVSPPGVKENLIRFDDKQFYEEGGFIADSTFAEIFTYEFLEGNARKALTAPNSVVISERLAHKLFGDESALNKVININQGGSSADFNVTGVIRTDKNSHLRANFFVSMSSSGWAEYVRGDDVADEWGGQNFMLSYVKLRPGYSLEQVVEKMNRVFMKRGGEDLKALGMTKKLSLEAVPDIHLYSVAESPVPRITYLYIVAAIATFVLLIACINFMNLSTAKAAQRVTEVGLRKTLGAQRGALVGQFLSETVVLVCIATVISVGIVQLALPIFSEITGKQINLTQENGAVVILSLLAITLVTGVVAGSYPAFYLSSFQPASILKGKFALRGKHSILRQSLVVFQFLIAITLTSGMFIMQRQLKFIQEKNLGFNSNHKIVLPLRSETAKNNYSSLSTEVAKIASVNRTTGTNTIPGTPVYSDYGLYPQGSSMEKALLIKSTSVEPNYLNVMGIKIIAGNNFPDHRDTTSWRKLIINREGAKQLGFTPARIVGEPLYFDWQGVRYEFEVVGVMEDFHQQSLKDPIFPHVVFVSEFARPNFMIVEANGENISETLTLLEESWKRLNSDTPFEFTYLDDNIQQQYAEDRKVSLVITSFTVISIIISCLGLYGLSTYMTERRIKEVGVRKVLGASARNIVMLLSREFVILVMVAFLIAVPIGWYAMDKWLEGFAYKTSIDIVIFIYAGASALAIALVTVSFESLRAAWANPVKSLRTE